MAELSDREYLKKEMARRELARKSYRRYLYYVHGDSWKRTRMSDYLADQVQAFVEKETGNAYDILLIETPPQHGKSLTVTESLPSWYLGRYPKHRIIEASYNDDTARRFGRKNLEKVEQYGAALFGAEKGSIWTTTEFELSNGWGRMISRGIMSGITGNPANLLIIDDPIKNREEADSETYRGKLWAEWQNTLKSRLAAGAKVIVIMTPWHEDDLAARLIQNEPTTTLIRLPVEAEELDLLGRRPGEALCPELGKDDAWLAQFKQGYINDPKEGGLRAWQALYQCSPRVEGGNLVLRDWWKHYDPRDISAYGTTVISVDAAFKDSDDNDFVAIQVWSKLGNNYYGRYGLKRHLNFPDTVQAIRLMKKLFPETRYILIEDKANGSAIIQTLQKEFVGVIGINPKGGKSARVNAVSPAIESGNVLLPSSELWAEELVDSFAAFPAAAHDDDVDACFVAGTMVATARGDRPIETIRPGELVWTPFGLRRVLWSGKTGDREVITRGSLTGTKNHPVYNASGKYDELQNLTIGIHCDILSLKGVIRWKYRRLSFSMALNTDSWEAEDIISVSQRPMKDDDMLKDFTWQFGSFIRAKKFLKAMKFITKTAILLTTTTATWSAYRCANTMRIISQRKESEHTLKKYARSLQSGTEVKRAVPGTANTLKRLLWRGKLKSMCASSVENLSCLRTVLAFVRTTVQSNGIIGTSVLRIRECVNGAVKNLKAVLHRGKTRPVPVLALAGVSSTPRRSGGEPITEKCYERSVPSVALSLKRSDDTRFPKEASAVARVTPFNGENERKRNRVPVYNLTVQGCHLYYAEGILVHNCTQALNFMLFTHGGVFSETTDARVLAERRQLAEEQELFLSPALYDPYEVGFFG